MWTMIIRDWMATCIEAHAFSGRLHVLFQSTINTVISETVTGIKYNIKKKFPRLIYTINITSVFGMNIQ